MNADLALIGLLITAVVICAGSAVMTLINLGYYRNPHRRGVDGRAPHQVGAGAAKDGDSALVSVCIPARNEERNIEACIRGVLASDYPLIEVLIYDDQSTDATPRILDRLMHEDGRIRRIETRPLPEGWVGKQWACDRLGSASGGDWLLFTDADVRFEPSCIAAALSAARSLGADMISTFPHQVTATLAEKLVVPMIHFILFSYLPMGRMRGSNAPSASAACGQFMMVRRDAYRAAGGHAAWKDSMHDGIRMPRAVRRAGFHTDLFDGTPHLSCRMYVGLRATWRGFAKNAYEGLGSMGLLLFLTALHLIGHVLPWAVVIGAVFGESFRGAPLVLAMSAIFIAIFQRWILARHFDQPMIGVALHPIGVLMMTAIQWHSFVLAKLGKRGWRGRVSA